MCISYCCLSSSSSSSSNFTKHDEVAGNVTSCEEISLKCSNKDLVVPSFVEDTARDIRPLLRMSFSEALALSKKMMS